MECPKCKDELYENGYHLDVYNKEGDSFNKSIRIYVCNECGYWKSEER